MEKQNSQLEHGQPMEQTSVFCMCASGVARCQSQHQYHFWRMSWMFKSILTYSLGLEMQVDIFNSANVMSGQNVLITKGNNS